MTEAMTANRAALPKTPAYSQSDHDDFERRVDRLLRYAESLHLNLNWHDSAECSPWVEDDGGIQSAHFERADDGSLYAVRGMA